MDLLNKAIEYLDKMRRDSSSLQSGELKLDRSETFQSQFSEKFVFEFDKLRGNGGTALPLIKELIQNEAKRLKMLYLTANKKLLEKNNQASELTKKLKSMIS